MEKRLRIIVAAIMAAGLIASFIVVPAFAQKDQLLDQIGQKKKAAEDMRDHMRTTDQVLAGDQEQADAGLDKIAQEDLNRISRDTSAAASAVSSWRGQISKLEEDYQDLQAKSLQYQLAPQDQAQVQRKMKEFHDNIQDLKERADTIDGRAKDLQGRVRQTGYALI